MKRLAIIGSTGSIGTQTLDVVRCFSEELEVVALCAGKNAALLKEQVNEFRPAYDYCRGGISVDGAALLDPCEMVTLPEVDLVVMATVGDAGMEPTLAAIEAGKSVALANKEILVMAGGIISEAARKAGKPILPIDSEPSAIWQCLEGDRRKVARLIITASGGAFRDRPWEQLHGVTPAEALAHPTWTMGQKITVDSATLVNKAFEVIEAHWLFDMPFERITALVHRQSIIHSMVEFEDGTFKAQLGMPDMRFPIQYALTYPEGRANASLPAFDPIQAGTLTFEELDPARYPCFQIAVEAGRRGDTWPAVLAAADEAAVEMFLAERIPFTDIPMVIEKTLSAHTPVTTPALGDIMDAAAWASQYAGSLASPVKRTE